MAPLIVITGPTASGKSGLALELAEHYGGEIICADSRTVYKYMDIGTAKPTQEERSRVVHHLLDVAEPNERFTVHDFQSLALTAIDDIQQRGKVPFLVGGTGLYIDSVVLKYEFSQQDIERRQLLDTKTTAELQMMIKNQHLILPINSHNKRHLVSVLMNHGFMTTSQQTPDENTQVVAISTNKNELEQRISVRANTMFRSGVLEEARQLSEKYGWENEAMSGNIYPILKQVIDGDMTETEAIERFIIRDRQLAKRQITWLKRHGYVKWRTLPEAKSYLNHILASLI